MTSLPRSTRVAAAVARAAPLALAGCATLPARADCAKPADSRGDRPRPPHAAASDAARAGRAARRAPGARDRASPRDRRRGRGRRGGRRRAASRSRSPT